MFHYYPTGKWAEDTAQGDSPMLKLIGKLGFVALVGMAVLGVWRAYTYSPQTRTYAPLVLGLLIIVVLMALSLLARERRR